MAVDRSNFITRLMQPLGYDAAVAVEDEGAMSIVLDIVKF